MPTPGAKRQKKGTPGPSASHEHPGQLSSGLTQWWNEELLKHDINTGAYTLLARGLKWLLAGNTPLGSSIVDLVVEFTIHPQPSDIGPFLDSVMTQPKQQIGNTTDEWKLQCQLFCHSLWHSLRMGALSPGAFRRIEDTLRVLTTHITNHDATPRDETTAALVVGAYRNAAPTLLLMLRLGGHPMGGTEALVEITFTLDRSEFALASRVVSPVVLSTCVDTDGQITGVLARSLTRLITNVYDAEKQIFSNLNTVAELLCKHLSSAQPKGKGGALTESVHLRGFLQSMMDTYGLTNSQRLLHGDETPPSARLTATTALERVSARQYEAGELHTPMHPHGGGRDLVRTSPGCTHPHLYQPE